MFPWKLRKRHILPNSQNRLSIYFSLAKFQLVSCNLSVAMIWQMTYTHKLPKLCSATLSKGEIERCTSTGGEAFFPLWICLNANKFSLSSVFTPKETIWPKIWTKSPPNKAKRLLMVDLRFCLLKLRGSCALHP